MPADSLSSLVNYGPLGIACIALGIAVAWLAKRLAEVQDKRVEDAKSYAALAERIAEQNTSAMVAMRSASEGTIDALARVEDALRRK